MKIRILTIAPEEFETFLKTPLIRRNIESGLLDLQIVDMRDYVKGSFRKIDDSPYGGGAGMILRCEPVVGALNACISENSHVVILDPIGKTFDQKTAHRLSEYDELIFLCGHFEGFDARIYDYGDEIISIGDYILLGGALPAMVVCEALMRLVDGSMKKESVIEESFENGILEYPRYTRPSEFEGKKVPEVLLSGNEKKINEWRETEAKKLTEKYRPDLLDKKR
ncbi:MAG: tRNA (guanosine(37)-N1)-methyltransferase TrmD [Erysipelotrichaceae bacterium]|nr:tRNA (guanosine(37)-N1)-methyltransferase TrmD [Erysipelotrichaceae bacterium]